MNNSVGSLPSCILSVIGWDPKRTKIRPVSLNFRQQLSAGECVALSNSKSFGVVWGPSEGSGCEL